MFNLHGNHVNIYDGKCYDKLNVDRKHVKQIGCFGIQKYEATQEIRNEAHSFGSTKEKV